MAPPRQTYVCGSQDDGKQSEHKAVSDPREDLTLVRESVSKIAEPSRPIVPSTETTKVKES